MPDEEHFLFSEWTINDHTREEMFAGIPEDPYIIL
jgi:hypothetical protein